MRPLVVALTLLAVGLPGCTGMLSADEAGAAEVREIQLNVGWANETTQYIRPATVTIEQGEKVRFVITNDDDPAQDYNGRLPGKDNHHDVTLAGFDADGDGYDDEIRHDVAAGQTVRTSFMGRDHFVAAESGTFRLVCTMMTQPSHESMGMAGELVVR